MPSFTIIFDVDKNSPTYGKWLFTDTTDYAALGWNANDVAGWFNVSFPNGNGYTGSQSAPDLSGGGTNNSISIPQDANGVWLNGTYTFVLNLFNTVLTQQVQVTITYKYCPPFKFGLGDEGTIATTTDCFQYRLGITDKTNYGTPTTKTELITLYPPQPLIDNGDATVVTSNSSSLLYVFGYTGTYVATTDTLVTYVQGNVTVSGRVTADKEVSVQCSLNICSLIACYNEKLRKLTHQVSKGGYLESVDNALKTDMLLASFYLLSYKENAACGNYDKATDDYNKLAKLLGCDCGCGDVKKISDDIRLVNPNFDLTVATVYNAIGQGAINVTTNTVGNNTTWTITLSQSFINTVNGNTSNIATLQGDVTTLQGDVTLLQSQVATLQSQLPILLHSDTAVNMTTSVSGDQVLKSYTLPAHTLNVNGDIIEVEVVGLKFGDSPINVYLELGGQPLFISANTSQSILNVTSQVVRTGANGQVVHSKGSVGAQPTIATSLRITNAVVSRTPRSIDLTIAQTLQLRVVKPSGNFTADEFRAILLTVKHFKK